MEETTTSWRNHSFTLLIFGGIVVLCSIFFVLGMLVGRNQGQQMAEMAFAEKNKNKPAAVAGADDLKLNYYDETTEAQPVLKLQPPPEPPTAEPGVSAAPAASGSSSTARVTTLSEKTPAADKPSTTKATAKPTVAKTSVPANKDRYLQILATKNQKQAKSELKKVQSKSFKALIMEVTLKNERWYRVMVGPYKESEVSLAQSDLKAKGYKDVILQK